MSKSLFYFHQWEISPGDLRGIGRTLVKQQWDSEGTWQDLPHSIQLSCWSLVSLRRQSNCLSWSLSCSQGEWHLPCYCSQLCGRSPLLLAFQTHLNQNKHGGCHLFLLKDHGLPMGLREDTFWKGLGMGFPGGSDGKKICLQCRRPKFYPWAKKIPWRREWLPTPVFLPENFHWQRSLAGCSPWGRKESDTTEQLTLSLLREDIFWKGLGILMPWDFLSEHRTQASYSLQEHSC